MSMNNWTFSGRLGADAELRATQGGEKVLSFRVANDVGFGERKTAQWVDCSMWGQRAEALAQYLTKGVSVVVAGEVTAKLYERRDGKPDAALSVRVDKVDFLGGGREGDGRNEGGRGQGGRSHQDYGAGIGGGDRDVGGRRSSDGGSRDPRGGGHGKPGGNGLMGRHDDLEDDRYAFVVGVDHHLDRFNKLKPIV